MNVTLLEVQSSVVLLKRSIRGQLERSATRFALRHVNDSRRSFERISTMRFQFDASILAAWSEAESMAKECAAVVIQGAVRRFLAIVHITEMASESHGQKRNSKVGARWRVILLRQDANATIIQSRFRAFRARKELEIFHAAATLLQATYRCHLHRLTFFRAQTAAMKLQYSFRKRLSRTIAAPPLRSMASTTCGDAGQVVAAALIQASVRGYQCSTHYHSSVKSVRVIQSYWRRRVDATRKSKELASAIIIQKWFKAVKRRLVERKELALATARGVHFVEEAILFEMERNARDQVGLLLLRPRRVRPTSACVRRLAKRVKSLSEDCKENHTRVKSNNAGLFTVYEQDIYTNAPV
jgi:IQ calmodulin-binding motif